MCLNLSLSHAHGKSDWRSEVDKQAWRAYVLAIQVFFFQWVLLRSQLRGRSPLQEGNLWVVVEGIFASPRTLFWLLKFNYLPDIQFYCRHIVYICPYWPSLHLAAMFIIFIIMNDALCKKYFLLCDLKQIRFSLIRQYGKKNFSVFPTLLILSSTFLLPFLNCSSSKLTSKGSG